MNGPLSEKAISDITTALKKGELFSCADKSSHFGTHMYFAPQSVCKVLVDHAFPIDIQVDSYIQHLVQMGKIKNTGYPVSGQVYDTRSSIQTGDGIPCVMNSIGWKKVLIAISVIILLLVYFAMRRCSDKKNCPSGYICTVKT
jgi:hypothetical protein